MATEGTGTPSTSGVAGSNLSPARTSRPSRSGICMASKKPGVTSRRLTMRDSTGSSDCPSGVTDQTPPRITIGRKLM